MAAKVRCAGGGRWRRLHNVIWQIPAEMSAPDVRTDPCGWKGKRQNDREVYGPHGMVGAAEMAACPRCGGRVELVKAGSP